MAISPELFNTLKDETTENGVALSNIVEGSDINDIDGAAGNAKGLLAFGFKDASGNAVLPSLNAEGAQTVIFDKGTTKRNRGTVAEGAQTKGTEAEIFNIVLTAEKTYNSLDVVCSASRLSYFRVVHVDDVGVTDTEVDLLDGIAGAGQFTISLGLNEDEFNTVGGTGVIQLKVYGTPLDKESDFYAHGSVNEIA